MPKLIRVGFILFFLFFAIAYKAVAQEVVVPKVVHHKISKYLPRDTILNKNYVFYLHGRIVEEHTDLSEAINPMFGLYQYETILDSLVNKGKNIVISEHRKKLSDVIEQAEYVAKQIDTLLKRNVSPERICVVGASKGGLIAMYVASIVGNKKVKYVWMASCGDDIEKDKDLNPKGYILSIIEKSDPFASTCYQVYKANKKGMVYRELELNLGLSHGFIYKPYREWLQPVLFWIADKEE
jgi:hypothetical protein